MGKKILQIDLRQAPDPQMRNIFEIGTELQKRIKLYFLLT